MIIKSWTHWQPLCQLLYKELLFETPNYPFFIFCRVLKKCKRLLIIIRNRVTDSIMPKLAFGTRKPEHSRTTVLIRLCTDIYTRYDMLPMTYAGMVNANKSNLDDQNLALHGCVHEHTHKIKRCQDFDHLTMPTNAYRFDTAICSWKCFIWCITLGSFIYYLRGM